MDRAELYEAVNSRLAMLGYPVAEEDGPAIEYQADACEEALLAGLNQAVLPEGLFNVLVDLAAGSFLREKLAAGALEGGEESALSLQPHSITEGDLSVTFGDGGELDGQGGLSALIHRLTHPSERVLGAFRRVRW